MKGILADYEKASRQAINLHKSEVFFSRDVDHEQRNMIINLLGVQACLGMGKYLGFSSMIGRSEKATFSYLKDRMWKRFKSWGKNSRCTHSIH